jgi:EpsI family protein
MISRICIVSILLLTGAWYISSASKSESIPIRRSLTELPSTIARWTEENDSKFDQKTLSVLGVDDYINRAYSNPDGARVGLYAGYYISQRQGDTIHSPLNCLPGSGWNPIQKDYLTIPIEPDAVGGSNSENITVKRVLIQKGLDQQIVIYWYQSQGRVVASEYWSKFYTVLSSIRMHRTDAALIRIISTVEGTQQTDEEKAEIGAINFVRDLFPLLRQYLPD